MWSGGLAEWISGDTAYLSVAFSWRLPDAFSRSVWHKQQGRRVRAGGPAVWVRPKYLAGVAELGGEVDALLHHNPEATRASRGCPIGCWFCVVPKMEGREFTLLPDFTPRPILCDNNVSGLPVDYQEYIIDRYVRTGTELRDINSGFEPRSFDAATYQRWKQIYKGYWRLAYDEAHEGEYVQEALAIMNHMNSRRKRVYVLIGNEPFDSCMRRIAQVLEWNAEPHVQPLMALNTLHKQPLVRHDWTAQKLKDVARWANQWHFRKMPFSEYDTRKW